LLDAIRRSDMPDVEKGELFSLAISYFKIGHIYKLTSKGRTQITDEMVVAGVAEFADPRVMEVGVSDGSSAMGLLARSDFSAKLFLTDRANRYYRSEGLLGCYYYDSEQRRIGYKLGFLYTDLSAFESTLRREFGAVETANPLLESRFGVSSIEHFNMFEDICRPPVHVVKCANLLNLEYFSKDVLISAVENIARSVVEGGYIVIGQNNERFSGGEAAFMLRKEGERLVVVKERNSHDAAPLFKNAGPHSGDAA
jgi:hypothetical protein